MEHWVFIERTTERSHASFEEAQQNQPGQIFGQELTSKREEHPQKDQPNKDRQEREMVDIPEEKSVSAKKGVERRKRLPQREERLVMVTSEWDMVESKARTAPDGAPAEDNREWALRMENGKVASWAKGESSDSRGKNGVDGEEIGARRIGRGVVGSAEGHQEMGRTIVELGESRRVILCEEEADDSADETEGEWHNEAHWDDQQKSIVWCESAGYQRKNENLEDMDIYASSTKQHGKSFVVADEQKEQSRLEETVTKLCKEYIITDILMPDDHIEDLLEEPGRTTICTEEAGPSGLANEQLSSSVQMTTERNAEDLPLEDWGPPVLHFMLPTIIPLPVAAPRERGNQEISTDSNPTERILLQPNPRHHAAHYYDGSASPAESTSDTPGDLSSPDSGCEITLTDAVVTPDQHVCRGEGKGIDPAFCGPVVICLARQTPL